MTKVGLIGYGYWGPNLARVFQQTPLCELHACSDLNQQKLRKASLQYPHLRTFCNVAELLDSDVDAVAIATSISIMNGMAINRVNKPAMSRMPPTISSQASAVAVKCGAGNPSLVNRPTP